MNNKVKQLGLSNTNFENVHGLDSENHYSCPYDMAMIAKELLKGFVETLSIALKC